MAHSVSTYLVRHLSAGLRRVSQLRTCESGDSQGAYSLLCNNNLVPFRACRGVPTLPLTGLRHPRRNRGSPMTMQQTPPAPVAALGAELRQRSEAIRERISRLLDREA